MIYGGMMGGLWENDGEIEKGLGGICKGFVEVG